MARRRKQPKAGGQFKLVALASVTYLPSYREAVKATSYFGPDVLCTLTSPNGKVLFENSAAREVTGLGKSVIGAMLRQKHQAIRSR